MERHDLTGREEGSGSELLLQGEVVVLGRRDGVRQGDSYHVLRRLHLPGRVHGGGDAGEAEVGVEGRAA